MNQLTYHCTCGCSFKAADIKITHIDGTKMYACLEHKAPVSHRTVKCQDPECGEVFQISRAGNVPKFCIPCREKKGIFIRYNTTVPAGKDRDKVKLPPDSKIVPRSDCVFRDTCLWEMALKDQTTMACDSCDDYTPKVQEIGLVSNRCDTSELYNVANF